MTVDQNTVDQHTVEQHTVDNDLTESVGKSPRPRRRRRWLVFVVGFVIVALLLTVARRRGEVELELVLPGEDFVQGKPVMMTFAVQNSAEHEITIDAWERFSDDDPQRCKSFEGIPVELTLYYENYPEPVLRTPFEPGDGGEKSMVPGEKLSFQCDIAYMFGIVKPGRYWVEARYLRDTWAHRPSLALPARLWSSIVTHDQVPFTVRSRVYDDKNTESKIRGNLK